MQKQKPGVWVPQRAGLSNLRRDSDLDEMRQADTETLLEVRRLRAEVRHLQEVLHRKNVALDALHWVWCDGGCAGGVHRWSDNTELSEDLVLTAERNTARMRRWLNNTAFKLERMQREKNIGRD